MYAGPWDKRLSVEDYLAAEQTTEFRHEYVGGHLTAMSGASRRHNIINLNIAAAIHAHLRGKPCQVFSNDMKVRLRFGADDIFYYPDVMVGCDPQDRDPYYLRHPKLIIEVLSPSTDRLDRREKFFAYQQLETLEEYLIVDQEKAEVWLYRREAGWAGERVDAPRGVHLRSLGLELTLETIYAGVEAT